MPLAALRAGPARGSRTCGIAPYFACLPWLHVTARGKPAPHTPAHAAHPQDEWLDFRREHRLGRLQLLPGADPSAWPPPPPRPTNPEALVPIDEAPSAGQAAGAAAATGGGSGRGQQPLPHASKIHGRCDVSAAGCGISDGSIRLLVRLLLLLLLLLLVCSRPPRRPSSRRWQCAAALLLCPLGLLWLPLVIAQFVQGVIV